MLAIFKTNILGVLILIRHHSIQGAVKKWCFKYNTYLERFTIAVLLSLKFTASLS